MKKCPFCAEEIQDEAIKCRHCGEFISKRCPYCAEEIQGEALKCNHCGEWLTRKPLQHHLIAFKNYLQPFYDKVFASFKEYYKILSQKIVVYKNKEPKGIGGWLLLFIINVFLSGISLILISNLLLDSFLAKDVFLKYVFYFGILIGVFAIYTGFCLSLKYEISVFYAKVFLKTILIYTILISIILLIEAPSLASIKGLFSTIIGFLIWNAYLNKSKRIKNTFHPSIDRMMIDARLGNEKAINYLKSKGIEW